MEINDIMKKFEETIQNVEETNNNINTFSVVLEKVNESIRRLDNYVQINDAASQIKNICDNTVEEFSILKKVNEKIIETQNILNSDVIKNIHNSLSELNKYFENLKSYKNMLSDIRKNIDEIKDKDIEVLRKETNIEKNFEKIVIDYKTIKEELTNQFSTVMYEVSKLKKDNEKMAKEINRINEANEEILNYFRTQQEEHYEQVSASINDEDIPF